MQNRNSLGLICQKSSEEEVRQIHCRAKCYNAKACLLLLTPSCIRYTHDYSHTTLARTHTHKPTAQFCVRCGGSATAGRGKGLLQGAASCTAHACDFPFPGFSPAGRSRDSRVETRGCDHLHHQVHGSAPRALISILSAAAFPAPSLTLFLQEPGEVYIARPAHISFTLSSPQPDAPQGARLESFS